MEKMLENILFKKRLKDHIKEEMSNLRVWLKVGLPFGSSSF